MKTLSIKQPWASLITSGIKNIENRTWKTNYRGRIYIHASSKPSFPISESILRLSIPQWDKIPLEFQNELHYNYLNVPQSSIIGEVDIIDCVIGHSSTWTDKDCYNWVLANPIMYEQPILNVKGALSLWEYERPYQVIGTAEIVDMGGNNE